MNNHSNKDVMKELPRPKDRALMELLGELNQSKIRMLRKVSGEVDNQADNLYTEGTM